MQLEQIVWRFAPLQAVRNDYSVSNIHLQRAGFEFVDI